MGTTVQTLILLGAAMLIFKLAKDAPGSLSPAWLLLTSQVGVSLLITLGLCLLQQYWVAGKAFSYIAYLVLLLLVASPFRASLDHSWPNRIALATASAFVLLQLGFFSIALPLRTGLSEFTTLHRILLF